MTITRMRLRDKIQCNSGTAVKIASAPVGYPMAFATYLLSLPFWMLRKSIEKVGQEISEGEVNRDRSKIHCNYSKSAVQLGNELVTLSRFMEKYFQKLLIKPSGIILTSSYTKQFVTNASCAMLLYTVFPYTNFLQSFLPTLLSSSPVLANLCTAAVVAAVVLVVSATIDGVVKCLNKEKGIEQSEAIGGRNLLIEGFTPIGIATVGVAVVATSVEHAVVGSYSFIKRKCSGKNEKDQDSNNIDDNHGLAY